MKKYFDRLYGKSCNDFYETLESNLKNNKKEFIITANPETFMKATNDVEMDKMLLDENSTLVPDGIGIVKAARILDYDIKERIPGIDIANKLLELGNKHKKTIYLFGAKEEVITSLCEVIKNNYPNLKIIGAKNGYEKDRDKVFKDIIKKEPDIVLVALGIPEQEKLIYKYLDKFKKGIFVGVGGSFDVMSGHKKRAPKIFQKLNLEWLYRIVKEPKRLKRFYDSNVKFMFMINKLKRKKMTLSQKVADLLSKIFFICYFIYSIYWFSIVYKNNPIKFIKYGVFILLIFILITFIFRKYKDKFKLNKKILIILLILIAIGIRLAFLFLEYNPPTSDYGTFFYNSGYLANNNIVKFNSKYVSAFPFLYGYMFVLSNFFKIFGSSYMIVIVLNIILDLFGALCIYLFSKNLFNKKIALISLFVWLFNPFEIYFNLLCSPVIIVNAFLALSLYITSIFLKNINKLKFTILYGILLGLILSITNSFRPIMIIFIIAIFIYLVYMCFASRDNKKINIVIGFIVLLSFYQIGNIIYNKQVSNITGYKIEKSLPGWSMYVGSNMNAKGRWTSANSSIFEKYYLDENYTPGKFSDKLIELSIERYKNNGLRGNYLLMKEKSKVLAAYTNDYLYDSFELTVNSNNVFLKQITRKFINIFWFTLVIFNLIFSLIVIKIKEKEKLILPLLLIIGLSASLLLVEVSPRYFFPTIVPLSFILSLSLYNSFKILGGVKEND